MNQDKINQVKAMFGKLTETEIRKKVRELFGVKKTRGNEIFRAIKDEEGISRVKAFAKAAAFKSRGDTGVAESDSNDVRTIEDLVAVCKIDLNEWFVKKVTSNVYAGNFQIKAEFERRKDEKSIAKMTEEFIEKANKHAPTTFDYIEPKEQGKLLVLNLQDAHFGKLCWAPETGDRDYDLKISKQNYKAAVYELVAKASEQHLSKILFIVGSDLLHFDTEAVTTTAGTRLDSDTRWPKMFDESCDLIVDVVEQLAEEHAVEVMVVPGNHGRLSEYCLGNYVKAWFRNHRNVHVNNEPLDRKYFGFGVNLIGFAHGDDTKLADLPLTLMVENQASVSAYKYKFFLTGHIHTDKMLEFKGIKVFVAPALCPPDKWHAKKGYVGNIQTSQALLFSAENGLDAIYYSRPVNS